MTQVSVTVHSFMPSAVFRKLTGAVASISRIGPGAIGDQIVPDFARDRDVDSDPGFELFPQYQRFDMEKIPQKGGINIGIEGDDRADDGPGDVLFSYALVFAIEGKAGPFLVDGPPFFEMGDIKKLPLLEEADVGQGIADVDADDHVWFRYLRLQPAMAVPSEAMIRARDPFC